MITPYFNNIGGLNITDSPISMQDNQATGQSFNYDYSRTGSITKVLAANLLNIVADTQLKTLGLGTHHDATTDARTLIRCAGTKIQTYNIDNGTTVNLAEDTLSINSDFLDSSSTQPVILTPFNSVAGGTQVYVAGGGMTSVYGANSTNVSSNGTPAPTGSITPVVTALDGGTFATIGVYYYGIQFRKTATQALSNVALDVSATITATTDSVTLPLNLVTNIDTSKYDQIVVWRSVVSGVTGFTTGSIIAKLAISATTYKDTGTSISDAQNTPRAGNTILDNSVLPTGTYKYVGTFKRRLIVASSGTFYVSDLDKPESWPIVNRFTPASGGPITGFGTIGVPTENTAGTDELLCIFKEKELWAFSGTSADDWQLTFVDKTGCAGQSLVVPFNGFVSWITYNGIYAWSGRGRPVRISKLIYALFEADGDLDKSKLSQGYGKYYEKSNQVIWRVSHRTKGVNKLSIKMDTRLTTLAITENLQNTEAEGIFLFDTDSNSYYAMESFKSSASNEILVVGDDLGFVYQMYSSAMTSVPFQYETKALDMGHPERLKRFKRVLVYVEKLTNNDLNMYFWADYRIRDEYKSKVSASMSPAKGQLPALWDVALWDQAYWDDYTPDIGVIEFNLHSNENNSEGTSLKLRFEQLEASAPVRIHGFEIEWEDASNLPNTTQQVI